jgi:CRP/FNR family transcriptional regulator, cyclic AMP receptor protein
MNSPAYHAWFTREECARLLVTRSALGDLNLDDALEVAHYMRPLTIDAGVSFIKEGQSSNTNYMVLVMEGDVRIESRIQDDDETQTIVTVVSDGALIGEMGVLDENPRSATCTACTDLRVAVMTRNDLMDLVEQNPQVGVRFMLAISKRLSDRLRETTRKLNKFVRLNRTMHAEVSQSFFSNTSD